jgi:hypothetical protein
MLIGFWIAGKITDYYSLQDGSHLWETIWLYPSAFALGVMLLFMILFKNEEIAYKT